MVHLQEGKICLLLTDFEETSFRIVIEFDGKEGNGAG